MKQVLLCGFMLLSCFYSSAQNPPKREMRGAWIATFTNIDWPTRTNTAAQQQSALVTILDHHAATGMNAVFLQVRSQCDAMYPSTIEPWSADMNGLQGRAPSPLWDPLQFGITETHKRGMEFHAWLNPYRVASNINSISGFNATHISKTHPEWTINVATSSTVTVQILNPGLPQVRDYITSVVVDIVNRYDLDGIHFDDYFYPQPTTGATINDNAAYTADPRGFPNTTAGRNDWRRDNVNLLIKRVYDTIRALKPWVKFGVAPTGIYRNSTNPAIGTPTSGLEHYTTLYCDSRKWMQQGWVDYLAPEVYWYIGQPGADYSKIVPWWNDNTYGRHMYIGMAGYKVNDANAGLPWTNATMFPSEMRLNRSYANISGEIVYNTSALRSTARLGFRDSLRLFFYNKPALLPTMPWRDSIAPGAATALSAVKYSNDSVVLNWVAPAFTASEMDKAKRFVIYRSTSPAIDITNANNILAITADETTTYRDKAIAPNTTYYYTVTSLDHFHNESSPSNTAANLPPTISCPPGQDINLGSTCSAMLPDYRSMAIVNNGVSTASAIIVIQSPAAGTALNGTGNTVVTLTATDKGGNASSCSFTVTTHDVTDPVINAVSASPALLFPPNHKMKMVTIAYTATDNCGLAGTTLSVSGNEAAPGTDPDWQVIDDHHVKLRAERNGTGTGRVYTIYVTTTDVSGNMITVPVTVTVPHDNGAVLARGTTMGQVMNGQLMVRVTGNPSKTEFIINTTTASQQTISVIITDNLGRLVEQRNGIAANTTIRLGSKYHAGVYYVELRQGKERQHLVLVKE
jgi:uncharacterized lipoprotein YddW (UPF0748 family)